MLKTGTTAYVSKSLFCVVTFDNYDGGRVGLVVVSLRDAGEPVLARLGDGRILL